MANYVIGDIQGCFDAFMRLLDKIQFKPSDDTLWLLGDIVNRGEGSLETLRYCAEHHSAITSVLGNHDFHLLACYYNNTPTRPSDTLESILDAPDVEMLIHWLRCQPLAKCLPDFQCFLSHAGLYPMWSIENALSYSSEVESILQGDEAQLMHLLKNIYGDQPNVWHPELQGLERHRFIINALTRMRFITPNGGLELKRKTSPEQNKDLTETDLSPWFNQVKAPVAGEKILFGHWAALQGHCPIAGIHALDTGCVWGGQLTAMRLEDSQLISVSA